jgi:hypothetical protein
MSDYLTTEDVRLFIEDRSAEDNPLDMDLFAEDPDIKAAMERAAREYNSIHPTVAYVDGNALPKHTNTLLYATVEQLYRAVRSRLRRNDLTFQAGGVVTNIDKERIAHLSAEIDELRQLWTAAAKDEKIRLNVSQAWGFVG